MSGGWSYDGVKLKLIVQENDIRILPFLGKSDNPPFFFELSLNCYLSGDKIVAEEKISTGFIIEHNGAHPRPFPGVYGNGIRRLRSYNGG